MCPSCLVHLKLTIKNKKKFKNESLTDQVTLINMRKKNTESNFCEDNKIPKDLKIIKFNLVY